MDRLALHLFGVIHVDRPSKVRAELDEYAGDLDAIFLERPRRELGLRRLARAGAFGPGILAAYLFYGLLFTPLYVVLVREPIPTEWVAVEAVAERYDLPVHHVDDHPIGLLADGALRWTALGWLAVLVPAWFRPVATATTVAVPVVLWGTTSLLYRIDRRLWIVGSIPVAAGGLVGAFWLGLLWPVALGGGVVAFLVLAVGTLSDRNRIMLERSREVADEEGYDAACLVTGKAHLPGMIDLADEVGVDAARSHTSKLFRRSDDVVESPGTGTASSGVRPADPAASTGLERRGKAALLDAAVGVLVVGPLLGLLDWAVLSVLVGVDAWFVVVAVLLGAWIGPVVYHARYEGRRGRTPGKRRADLLVVRTDGSAVGRGRALARNLLRPLDMLTLYGAGAIVATLTDRNRKPSDLLTDTVVVPAEPVETAQSGDGVREERSGTEHGESADEGSGVEREDVGGTRSGVDDGR